MESPGMVTRNTKEYSARPTRRFRSNNNHNTTVGIKTIEAKEQENVNSTSVINGDANLSLRDEITIESKATQSSTANANLSTPRSRFYYMY